MKPDRCRQIDQILQAALDRDPRERPAFLQTDVRRRRLIADHHSFMTPERYQQIDKVFQAAIDRDPPAREAFLMRRARAIIRCAAKSRP